MSVALTSPAGMPRILLIAFKFPPYSGVGGNRWMHLTNHLARLGCSVHVVTVKRRRDKTSPWAGYEPAPGVKVHQIPSGFPHRLDAWRPRGRALRYFKAVVVNRHFLRRIWWDDEAQRWGRFLLPFCERLVSRTPIDALIATGHPFESNYLAAQLSARTGLPLVQDLRDPWLDNPYVSYSSGQRRILVRRIEATLRQCQRVVAVTEGLLELYGRYVDLKAKGVVIPNGHAFDSRHPARRRDTPIEGASREARLVYIGNIGNGRDEPFAAVLGALAQLGREGSVSARVDVYSLQWQRLKTEYAEYVREGLADFRTPVRQDEVLGILQEYDAALHLTARAFPYLVSTKIYEYAAAKIPTIAVDYGGEIERLTTEMDCGFSINLLETDPASGLSAAIQQLDRTFGYKVESYRWTAVADKYLDLVKSVIAERAEGRT